MRQNLFIVGVVLAMTSFSMASQPKYFTDKDYRKLTANGEVRINVLKSAKSNLNFYGSKCTQAALASVITKVYEISANEGVDYPEVIDVTSASSSQPMPGVYLLHITSHETLFTTRVISSVGSCLAEEASASPTKIDLSKLQRIH